MPLSMQMQNLAESRASIKEFVKPPEVDADSPPEVDADSPPWLARFRSLLRGLWNEDTESWDLVE